MPSKPKETKKSRQHKKEEDDCREKGETVDCTSCAGCLSRAEQEKATKEERKRSAEEGAKEERKPETNSKQPSKDSKTNKIIGKGAVVKQKLSDSDRLSKAEKLIAHLVSQYLEK